MSWFSFASFVHVSGIARHGHGCATKQHAANAQGFGDRSKAVFVHIGIVIASELRT
jgi:hypothetical protein